RSSEPRPNALRSLCRPEHPLRDVRLARPRRPEGEHHPLARGEVGDLERRKDGHVHPAHRREVPRRHELRCRCCEVEHRAVQDDAGLAPNGRPFVRGHRHRRRSEDREVQPQVGVRAAPRGARRPRGDDGLAKGRRGSRRRLNLKPFKAGTGPFILTEAVKNDHYTLEKNPDWWGKDANGNKLPYLDKVTVKIITDADVRLTNLRTGNVQLVNLINGKDVPAVKADTTLNYQEVGSFAFNSMVPNEAQGYIFNEKRYVKAVAMAIDRDEILNRGPAQGVGLVGYGPISPAHFAYDPNFKPLPKADPDGAKKPIADVGKGPLKFELLVPSGDAATLQLAQP